MEQLGRFALLLGLCLSSYAILADLLGARGDMARLLRSGRNATIASLICLTVAVGVLWILLVQDDVSVGDVAEHPVPLAHRLAASWSGNSGSLLLWLWLQTAFVVLAFSSSVPRLGRFNGHARAAANLVAAFFFSALVFRMDPFALPASGTGDGTGLNPLAQHAALALHPLALAVGYAALAVPFAWAFASLKQTDAGETPPLFARARTWALVAWPFLTASVTLRAWWVYEERARGSYWTWDSVESLSLASWLTATALLYCGRMYRANTRIAGCPIVLALVTFSLGIVGAFLARSGLVSSGPVVAEPEAGRLFLILLIHIWVLAGILLWRRGRRGPKEPLRRRCG